MATDMVQPKKGGRYYCRSSLSIPYCRPDNGLARLLLLVVFFSKYTHLYSKWPPFCQQPVHVCTSANSGERTQRSYCDSERALSQRILHQLTSTTCTCLDSIFGALRATHRRGSAVLPNDFVRYIFKQFEIAVHVPVIPFNT